MDTKKALWADLKSLTDRLFKALEYGPLGPRARTKAEAAIRTCLSELFHLADHPDCPERETRCLNALRKCIDWLENGGAKGLLCCTCDGSGIVDGIGERMVCCDHK